MPDADPPASPPPQTALGSRLSADVEALQNDVEQARELAAELQGQTLEKSEELERVKTVLSKTQADLQRMDGNVQQLRRERHALANQATRIAAMEARLANADVELQRLGALLELLSAGPAKALATLRQGTSAQQAEIDRLKGEILLLEQPGGLDRVLQKEFADLTAAVAALQEQLRKQDQRKPRELGLPEAQSDAINLSQHPR